ncbi:MAG: hypothetical protein IIC84_07500 [Chloroflexi bacterium]|nr:hypothetical protein [Chloroflexota bacterium]
MDCDSLRYKIIEAFENQIITSSTRTGCRVELPLLEPNGDSITIFVENDNDGYIVHEGGHIFGLLFDVGPAGSSTADQRAIKTLVEKCGLEENRERGFIYARANDHSLTYWIMEIGRTVAVAASIIPVSQPRTRRPRRLGPRVASELTQRLLAEGLMRVIRPAMNVRGITQREFRVDFSYTIPESALAQERTVFILTFDLDVNDPLGKADRGLRIATDLRGSDVAPDIRVVYSAGSANGKAESAKRLFKAASSQHLFEDYSWDDDQDRYALLSKVGQEVAPLLVGS